MTVEHGLAAMLRAALVAATEKTGDEDASTEAHLTQCFPIFSIMGKLRTAEEVFAEVLVRPRLEEVCMGLVPIIHEHLAFVQINEPLSNRS